MIDMKTFTWSHEKIDDSFHIFLAQKQSTPFVHLSLFIILGVYEMYGVVIKPQILIH